MNDSLAHTTRNQGIEILDYQPTELIRNSSDKQFDDYFVYFPNSLNAISHVLNRSFLREKDILPLAVERLSKPQLRIAHKSDTLESSSIVTEEKSQLGILTTDDQARLAVSISYSIDRLSLETKEIASIRERDELSNKIVDIACSGIEVLPDITVVSIIEEDEERIEGDIKFITEIGISCSAIMPKFLEVKPTKSIHVDKVSRIVHTEETDIEVEPNHFFSEYRQREINLYDTPKQKKSRNYDSFSYSGTENIEEMKETKFLGWLKKKNKQKDATRLQSQDSETKKAHATPITGSPLDTSSDLEKNKSKKNRKKKKKKKSKKDILKSIAKQSYELKDEIVSETLADLLAYHGHNEKAIEMYHKLILLNPKKSSYFAARINELTEQE